MKRIQVGGREFLVLFRHGQTEEDLARVSRIQTRCLIFSGDPNSTYGQKSLVGEGIAVKDSRDADNRSLARFIALNRAAQKVFPTALEKSNREDLVKKTISSLNLRHPKTK